MELQSIDAEEIPRELLLLADPFWEKVKQYLPTSHAIAAVEADTIVGSVLVSYQHTGVPEIVNLAVRESHQGRGIGRALIQQAISFARAHHFPTLIIATANSSIGQLALYQKVGFRLTGIDFGFFPRVYPDPIFENGIPTQHKIILSLSL